MKKSTLITTIAMIVVVVVALSTATYAWFSSSQTTQTTQEITTAGEAGITVLTNSALILNGSTPADFSETKLLTNTQGAAVAGTRAGLWAPKGTILATGVYPTANTATDTNVGGTIVSFISGKQNNAKTIFTIETPSTETSPDLIRVTNNTAGDISDLYMNVYISARADLPSYYAAQGFSFVVIKYSSDSAGAAVANTAYGYLKSGQTIQTIAQDGTASAKTGGNAAVEEANDGYLMSGGSNAFDSQLASGIATKNYTDDENPSNTYNHRAVTTDPGTGWSSNNVADMTNTSVKDQLVTGGRFYCISINMGSLVKGASMNYLLYSWLDGTYLGDAAKNALIKVVYSFATSSVTELGATPTAKN